jgi:hypothetical protein
MGMYSCLKHGAKIKAAAYLPKPNLLNIPL